MLIHTKFFSVLTKYPVPVGRNCAHNFFNFGHGGALILKLIYVGHLKSKERFAIKKYLLIIGKRKNMQVLSHTFTYFST
jgi:hypothetical protein